LHGTTRRRLWHVTSTLAWLGAVALGFVVILTLAHY